MLDVLTCISTKHDPWLVLLAISICALSVATTLQAYATGLNTGGRNRVIWLGLSSGIFGSGAWAAHFVAMLAYCPALPIHYQTLGTIISLLLGVGGSAVGFLLAGGKTRRPILGGALVGLSIAAMHYIGIGAIHGMFRVEWNLLFVASSLAISVIGSAFALGLTRNSPSIGGWIGAAAVLVLSVIGLHFTGMTAVKLTPDLTAAVTPELMTRATLALFVVGVVLLVLFATLCLLLVEAQSHRVSVGSLKIAFQGVPSGIALFDRSGTLVLQNEAYGALHRSFGAEVLTRLSEGSPGEHDPVGAGPTPAACLSFQEALAGCEGSWEGEITGGRWLNVGRQVLINESVVVVLSEVTNLRQWAEAMQTARDNAESASRAKSDFLANMSHEIRTPLNGVLGMIQAMKRDTLSPVQRQRVEVAHESGNALLATLNDILDLAKVEAGRVDLILEPFDGADLARSVCAAFAGAAAAKNLALIVEIEPAALGWWLGDAPKLRQVLSNLISNGLKFTPHGAVTFNLTAENSEIVFRITDTGIGIDDGDADRLFEKFAQADTSNTRKFGGTGLGLSISRELVTLMGGRITIESHLGKGACFTVALRLARADAPLSGGEAAGGDMEALNAERALSILVAEDNPVNQIVISSLLKQADVVLTVVGDGERAVKAFLEDRFDAVLMDIQMPQMNGVEACRVIREIEQRENRVRTPIIALTADCMGDQLEDYRGAGMDAHVPKPIEVERLYAVLADVLERPASSPLAA